MPPMYQAPPGTRDFYPADLLARRYIEKLWRDTALRHGFEEIDGPTFEHADLYAVKSGEGILSELFQTFSGKDPQQALLAGQGRAPYALRPEFTPTLARLYAARAGSLPKPCRWFWQQNCFRAERQQRGRLREFLQWNCDVLGGDPTEGDADAIHCLIDLLDAAGLSTSDVRVELNHRAAVAARFAGLGIPDGVREPALQLLDAAGKLDAGALRERSLAVGIPAAALDAWLGFARQTISSTISEPALAPLVASLGAHAAWCVSNPALARGLAYYTGTVFEVHEASGAERALAGGGRYDYLIELFAGPATPAVGFGMGDVVLSNVLRDRGLLPEGEHLLDALSAPGASYRPDAFVVSNGSDDAAAQVRPLLARLRRGSPAPAWLARSDRKPWDADRFAPGARGVRPLHARASGKSTKNVGKLIQDALAQRARLAVIVESGEDATVQDLSSKDAPRERIALEQIPAHAAACLARR